MSGSDILSTPSLLKQRKNNTSKRDFGTLVCVCGSAYYRGAAALSVKAALRSGVGLCCLASTEKVVASVASKVNECTYLPLEENENGAIASFGAYGVIKRCAKASAALIGPGLSLDADTEKLVCDVVLGTDIPLVLDADALNALAKNPEVLLKAGKRCVITPHFGEAARLCGVSYGDVASDPRKYAEKLYDTFGCCVVLKSFNTYIVSEDGLFVCGAANSGLAKGGSGDVLAGLIAGLAAQGYSLCDASRLGVYIHSEAGKKAADALTGFSVLPSEITDYFSAVFSGLTGRTNNK